MSRLAAALLLAACGGAMAAPAGEWSIVGSPNSPQTPARNFLYGTACVTNDDCWAVGWYYIAPSTTQTLVQHWDGSQWSRVPSPNTSPTQGNLLRSVSCTSASDCWAVGSYSDGSYQQTLTLHWDGSAWSIVTSPNTSAVQYNYLIGVSCVSAADCTAVGYYSGAQHQTLIERWNGTAWAIVASPNTGTSQANILYDVTCNSGVDCWAVGFAVDGVTGFERTLIERWNGTAWAVAPSPNALVSTNNNLNAVTCTTVSDCWAVGSSYNGQITQTLVARWNGSAWSTVTSANTGATADNVLTDVSCLSAADCWAVGSAGATAQTLVEHWNGSAWATAASPGSSPTQENRLWGLSCVAGGGSCRAAGYFNNGSVEQTLVERLSAGAWVIEGSANATTAQNNTLLGIDCASPSDCWAVASYYNGSAQQALTEHWDGSGWSVVAAPNTSSSQYNLLYEVKCLASSDCWAIGYYTSASAWQPLALHWNGSAWSSVAIPANSATQDHFLTALHCVSTSDCWAAGYYNNGTAYQTLIEHWNGAAWSIVASPNHDAVNEQRLNGISCASAADCWAVGHYFDGTLKLTLAEHWDGASWQIVGTPNTGNPENYLNGIDCVAGGECRAVGRYRAAGVQQVLAQQWDGSAWALVAAPSERPDRDSYLSRIDCVSASDCWSTGARFADGHFQALVEHWDGSAWSIAPVPATSPVQANYLVGVRCLSAYECWAVGQYISDAGAYQTLTQRYRAPLPPPTGPDAFGFLERTGVATGVMVTSETTTLAGFTGMLPVAVSSGGQYRIDAGSWTSASGQIAAGSTLAVRHVSAGTENTAKVSTVAVGAYSTEFKSVTSALDRTPDAFGFATQSGVAPGATVESNIIILSGSNTAIALQPGPGLSYRVDGGAWTTAAGTLQAGQTLQVRHTASGTSLGYTKSYIKAGGVTGYFTTRTR